MKLPNNGSMNLRTKLRDRCKPAFRVHPRRIAYAILSLRRHICPNQILTTTIYADVAPLTRVFRCSGKRQGAFSLIALHARKNRIRSSASTSPLRPVRLGQK